MDTMLARYLDGELTEHEARVFQTKLETNRALAAELREIEAGLDLLVDARCRGPSTAFVAKVMNALPPAAAPRSRSQGSWRVWALAASVVLCFGGGWIVGRMGPGIGTSDLPVDVVAAIPAESRPLRWVRLVLAPDDPDVHQVAVAGDFNGWNAEATPMERHGAVWVTWLQLPADVYEYMFVVDGERWLVDPLAVQTRDDGFGGENAVLDLSL